ncbi:2-hydroxychromene-2-carboxylate isomerase [uncultured Roseobacter sp.]|uniref:2-hydroxychromene-2-carboxylate isomerase n=1 Tax=uncultured Roseobacter sp. TaxID=114847 RepID=UPI0026055252|nr:2-hydroxychromene-2-carboxylate isomerase [uncultured Roseobacter sp.]
MNLIEYFYSVHSAFAYIGSKRLREICADHNVQLVHRPILLTPVVEAQGSLPFRGRTQAHVDYFFGREIERWAEFRGVPVINFRPTHHDADYSLASGMILALGDRGREVDEMSHAVLEAHWRDDHDLSDSHILCQVAHALGHDGSALLDQAASQNIQEKLRANTQKAQRQNLFGSPTYIVNGDPFYGQDRLELVARAIVEPFAPTTWENPAVD